MNELDQKVLTIVASQGPHYLIHSTATAFMVEGLQPGDVEESLLSLCEDGYVEHLTTIATKNEEAIDEETNEVTIVEVDVVDDEGNRVILDHGWSATEKGLQAVKGEGGQ